MLHIKLYKDKNGKDMCLFTCDHQQTPRPVMDEEACRPTIANGNVYRCAMELRHQDPKKDPSVGCIGGYKMCQGCDDVAGRFIDASQDAKAIRDEWKLGQTRSYSVSQCNWATSGLPRLGKNEKGATTPAILHKAADQPVVQYHCITL